VRHILCVDEVRNVLARQYLAATELSIAKIALPSDYSEPMSFSSAFVGWNEVTPIE
jgi:AraC-like DNA-binding protein